MKSLLVLLAILAAFWLGYQYACYEMISVPTQTTAAARMI